MTDYKGCRVSWVDTRFNPDNGDVENGVITGEGKQGDGVEYWEISQAGKYRAIDKRMVKSIDHPDF